MVGADVGGILSVVRNYWNFIDRDKIQFDMAFTTNHSGKAAEEFRSMGSNVYPLPLKSEGLQAFEAALTDLLKKEHFDAVHVHENETSYVSLRIAKKAGVKHRIAHAHTSSPYTTIKGEIRRLSGCVLNYHYATCVVGCGELAGQRVFGKRNMKRGKAMVLPNAVDADRFGYNEAVRDQLRQELGVADQYVLGMVGRLSEEKNYPYALRIMEQYHAADPHAVLLIVGDGDQEEPLMQMIRAQGMESYVKLLGRRSDVEKLYQAFDVLLLPSFHEGFPVVAVEAMVSGLPVLLSATITRELDFGTAVRYLSLDNDDQWLAALEEFSGDINRCQRLKEIKENGLDIRDAVKQLETLYLTGMPLG